MAKMAYFDGNSFLSSASDIFAGIGTGNYEIRFKIKSFNSLRSAIFGVDGEYGGLVFVDDQGGNPGTGLIATGLIDGSYPYIRDVVIPDNTIHTIKIKGVVEGERRIMYASIDNDEYASYDSEILLNWNWYSNIISSGKTWNIGQGLPDEINKPSVNFVGLISEFEFLGNSGEQIVYLPLTEDFLDHSGNEVPITNNGVTLVDDSLLPTTYMSKPLSYYQVKLVNGTWMMADIGALHIGDIRLYGYTLEKCGVGIVAKFIPPIPSGSQISSAALSLLPEVSELPEVSGLAKGKIIGYKSTTPNSISPLANYQAIRGTVVGGEDDSNLTTAYEVYDSQSLTPDERVEVSAKTPIQEIINIGDVSDLVIFFDDHDGRSPENNVYAFSNNFGDGWIVVELGSEPVSKKVMVLK
jgi:hypothetical protein